MAKTNLHVNVIFGCVAALLGSFSLAYFYYQKDHGPVIQPPTAATLPPDHPKLPEDHPPLDYAKELMALEQLSRDSPKNPEYKTRIGNLYYDLGQYRKAIEAYYQSLALRPQDPNVETDIATCLHYLGQNDEALEVLERVLRYSPNFPQALFNKGVILHSGKNDTQGAIAAWEELLQVHPNIQQRADLERRINQLKSAGR